MHLSSPNSILGRSFDLSEAHLCTSFLKHFGLFDVCHDSTSFLNDFPDVLYPFFFLLKRPIRFLVVSFHAPDIPIVPQMLLLNAYQFTLQAYFLFNVLIPRLVPPHDSLNQPQLPAHDS